MLEENQVSSHPQTLSGFGKRYRKGRRAEDAKIAAFSIEEFGVKCTLRGIATTTYTQNSRPRHSKTYRKSRGIRIGI